MESVLIGIIIGAFLILGAAVACFGSGFSGLALQEALMSAFLFAIAEVIRIARLAYRLTRRILAPPETPEEG